MAYCFDADLHVVHFTDAETDATTSILDYVGDYEYDHVVMGHHGNGWVGHAIIGSAAEKVLHTEAVPVTVVP